MTELDLFVKMLERNNKQPNRLQTIFHVEKGLKYTEVWLEEEKVTASFTFFNDTGELRFTDLCHDNYKKGLVK